MNQKETLVKFRLKNFRSFADTGDIEIKPINFLVGANSSGKSSILKFFPLLKQSVRRNMDGVFNWWGDDVDFKDFNNTVRQNETEMKIDLEFSEGKKVSFEIIGIKEYFDMYKSISLIDAKETYQAKKKEMSDTSKRYFFPFMNNKLMQKFDNLIGIFSQSICYIKPIRANIDRYYRFRNDITNEIASDGSNLPMFLYSLPPKYFKLYNKFLNDNFGFEIDLRTSGGTIEILISEKDSISRNAVDVGYGYTELLPILTAIWNLLSPRIVRIGQYSFGPLIAIEQPEVHLHPKFQAKFAKMLCKVIKNYPNVRFFIETHSETILNSIGSEIDYARANADDINVLLIEKQNGISTVKSTGYDNDGYLKDWPTNFLDEDAY